MRRLAAILWLDGRLVRRDLALLAALVVVMPPLASFLGPPGTPSLLLEFFGLPLASALLAATLSAGDASLAFLRARPLAWSATVLVRLAHRALLLSGLCLLGRIVVRLLGGEAGDGLSLAGLAPLSGVLGCTAAAGSFTRRPLAALTGGLLAFTLASFAVAAGLQVPVFESLVQALVGLVSLPLAALLLWARTEPSPLPLRRTALRVAAAAAVLFFVALLPLGPFVQARVRSAEQAWDWLPPAAPVAPLAAADAEAALARLREAGIACGPLMGGNWLPRRSQCAWLRAASRELRARSHVERAGTSYVCFPTDLPIAEQAAVLDPVQPQLRRAVAGLTSAPITREAQLLHFQGRDDLQLVLVGEALVARAAGESERSARALELDWRLFIRPEGQPWPAWRGDVAEGVSTFVRLFLRLGLPASREMEEALDDMDLRESLARDAHDERGSWLGVVSPGLVDPGLLRRGLLRPALTLRMAKEHEELGRLLGDWSRNRTCFEHVGLAGHEDWPVERLATRWQSAERLTLEAQLTARVLARRVGRGVAPESHCAGTRWVERAKPDGSWSIRLEGGPPALRHDEPASGPEELWRRRWVSGSRGPRAPVGAAEEAGR